MQYPPLWLTLTLALTCCSLGLVVGILVLGFILSMGNRKEEKEKKDKTLSVKLDMGAHVPEDESTCEID